MLEKEYFPYGEKEVEYLKRRDPRMGAVIEKLGHIDREVDGDLFRSLVNCIIGQQISMRAQDTIWRRLLERVHEITPDSICALDMEELQKIGISFRKASYIKDCAARIESGALDLSALSLMDDDEVIRTLSSLRGIGVWTAEMLMLFSMRRMNVLSYGDMAILRGMRMLYHHREISRTLFEKYRRRYSPYASVASLYLWAVAGGAVEGMRDYAPGHKK